MQKLLLAATALVALVAQAQAADMPVKAPQVVAAVNTWTGCFIGINGGYGSSRIEIDSTAANPPVQPLHRHNATGGVFGGQVGCDVQSDNWVVGLEGKGDWAHLTGSSGIIPNPAVLRESEVKGFVTWTARVGWLAQSNLLLYVRGGAALLFNEHTTLRGVTFQSAKDNRGGLLAGGGLEYRAFGNWSLFAEYNYVHTLDRTVTWNDSFAGRFSLRQSQNLQLGLVGINYRFGGFGAPVAARY